MNIGKNFRTQTINGTFDAIVIGSGIGGLSVSALLSRAGKRVLLLERHYVAGGLTQTFKRRGYEWDVGLHYMGDVHRSGSRLRAVFDYVSDDQLKWAPMPDVYNRIVIGDRSYDYVSGVDRFKAKLKEYFPAEASAVDRYVELVFTASRAGGPFFGQRAIDPALGNQLYDGMSAEFRRYSDRTTLETLLELTDDRELIAVLTGHYGDYGLPPGRSSFGVHAMLIRHYIHGASFPVGGAGSLARTIVPVIERAGGALFTSAEVEQVLVQGNRAVGVRMAGGREIFAPIVVSNAGALNTFNKLIPRELSQAHELGAKSTRIAPSKCCMYLNVGVRAPASELGLHPANLWIHSSNDFDGDMDRYDADPTRPIPVHFFTFPSLKDPTWEERYPGRTTISICSYTNFDMFRRWIGTDWKKRGPDYDALKERLTEELLGQIDRFVPQVRGKIEHVELATPLTFRHFAGYDTGNFLGYEHTPERFKQRWLRPHTPIENLFLTGQDITCDGVSSALLAGVLSASAILGRNVFDDIARAKACEPSRSISPPTLTDRL